MRAMVMLVTLVALGSSVSAAQSPLPVPPGSTVRLTFDCDGARSSCRRERGVLVGADAVGLMWTPDGASAVESRSWSAIGALEVSRGRRRQVLKGAMIGALAGAVPGALSGASYARTCECPDPNIAGGAVIGALIFAVPGALLGAGIGALVRTERWENLSPQQLRVSVEPRRGGLGVGLAVPF